MSHDIDFSTLNLRDTLDLAIAIEEEAKERYDEFAEQLEAHRTPEVAKFFRFMSDNEVKHAEVLATQRTKLFGSEPNTAAAKHRDGLAPTDSGGVNGSTKSSRDPTTDQTCLLRG